MTKRTILYNKMMLGALTLGDLRELVDISGEFCFGVHWLPISRARKKGDMLGIHISNFGREPDVKASLFSVVRVQGNMVFVDIQTKDILGGFMMNKGSVELRIRLDDTPFPEICAA